MLEWISVKDRLPDRSGEYLITFKLYGKPCVLISGFEFDRLGTNWKKAANGDVTHWMPVPLPPNEE